MLELNVFQQFGGAAHAENITIVSGSISYRHSCHNSIFFPPTIRSQPVSPLLRDPGEDPKAAKTRVLPKQLKR